MPTSSSQPTLEESLKAFM